VEAATETGAARGAGEGTPWVSTMIRPRGNLGSAPLSNPAMALTRGVAAAKAARATCARVVVAVGLLATVPAAADEGATDATGAADAAPSGIGAARKLAAVARYGDAADVYERYATAHPADADARDALREAVVLRLGLGQDAQATADASAYLKTYGAASPTEAARIALAMAAHHLDKGRFAEARAAVSGAAPLFEHAPLYVRIVARSVVADAYARSGDAARANAEYAKVVTLGEDNAQLERELSANGGADTRRVAKALVALGDARFALAEERRRVEVDSLAPPPPLGRGEAALVAYARTRLLDWVAKKRAAIEGVEHAYTKVLEVRPVPPPGAVVAAGASVGAMWADLAEALVPPPAWAKNAKVAAAYEALRQPIEDGRAKQALRRCVDYAAKFQVLDARAARCGERLARISKGAFHTVDEIVPRFVAGSKDAAMPFDWNGVPVPSPTP
jgi:tetratricopeptide (TPR) repeat protein